MEKLNIELKRLIDMDVGLDKDVISVYSILSVLRNISYRYITKRNECSYDIKIAAEEKYGYYSQVEVIDFDYENEVLKLLLKKGKHTNWEPILIKKENGRLKTVNNDATSLEFVVVCYDSLNACYDYFINSKGYYTETIAELDSKNTNFTLTYNKDGISVKSKGYSTDIKIDAPIYPHTYEIECEDEKLKEEIRPYMEYLLSGIRVDINECPSWIKEDVITKRTNEVKEEARRIRANERFQKIVDIITLKKFSRKK